MRRVHVFNMNRTNTNEYGKTGVLPICTARPARSPLHGEALSTLALCTSEAPRTTRKAHSLLHREALDGLHTPLCTGRRAHFLLHRKALYPIFSIPQGGILRHALLHRGATRINLWGYSCNRQVQRMHTAHCRIIGGCSHRLALIHRRT